MVGYRICENPDSDNRKGIGASNPENKQNLKEQIWKINHKIQARYSMQTSSGGSSRL